MSFIRSVVAIASLCVFLYPYFINLFTCMQVFCCCIYAFIDVYLLYPFTHLHIALFMIDWLDITIPCPHAPIAQGAYVVIEHDGTIRREHAIRRQVEGSYCGSLGVSSVTPSVDRIIRALPPSLAAKLFPPLDLPPGYVSHLHISGNPTKFLQGHNCFGTDDLQALAYRMTAAAMGQLGFDAITTATTLQRVRHLDFQVSRIDITYMFDLGADEDVDNYLYMLPSTVKARGDRCDSSHGTFYVGKHSGLWTIKFYNKLREILSRSKSHGLPDELRGLGIEDFVAGQLRVELTLRKKQLERYGMTDASKLSVAIEQLFREHAEKIEMTNQSIEEKRLLQLSNTYQGTYQLWKSGYCLKTHLSKRTFYRHRSELLKYGIDISLPPVAPEERKAVVHSIVKHLVPRQVTEIPAHLRRFVVRSLEERMVA